MLLQCGADVDKQDIDGWSPLHAASYWGQKETAQLLSEALADMDAKNFVVSQTFVFRCCKIKFDLRRDKLRSIWPIRKTCATFWRI